VTSRSTAARLLAAAAAAAISASAAAADAFCRSTTCTGPECLRDEQECKTTGAALTWASSCVGYSLQQDGTVNLSMIQVRKVIRAAFVAWTDLPCEDGNASIGFVEQDDVECQRTEFNEDQANANIVLFQDNAWRYKGIDNTLAKTTVTFDESSGEILDADIEVNHAYNEFTVSDQNVKYDLLSVITHEVGHFIGMDHSPDYDATMFAGYDQGTIDLRTLEQDDIDGACAAYPSDRGAVCEPTPRNGFGYYCGEDTAVDEGCSLAAGPRGRTGGAALVALALLAVARRGRRRVRRLTAAVVAMGALALSGCGDDTESDPPGDCGPLREACEAVESECVALADNAGKSRFALRIAQLSLTTPPSFAQGPLRKVVADATQINSCLNGLGTFNWLIELDTAAGTLRTGSAKPVNDPLQGYCFSDETLEHEGQSFEIRPATAAAQLDGSSLTAEPIPALDLLFYLDAGASTAAILPLRSVRFVEARLSSDQQCIGSYDAASLSTDNGCEPQVDGETFVNGGKVEAVITLEDADQVIVRSQKKSLCVMISGAPQDFGDGADPVERCLRDAAGNIVLQGDWCAATDAPATAECADAVRLGADMAASAVRLRSDCP
jgi:hypothetical protein